MNNILFNRLLFVAELWGTFFIFACRLRKRRLFWLRYFGCIAVIMGIATVTVLFPDDAWLMSFIYIAVFVFSVCATKLCFDEPWQNLIFCGVAAYTTQHLAYEFGNLVLTLTTNGTSPLLGLYGKETIEYGEYQALWLVFYGSIYALCCYVVYCAAYFVFARKIRSEDLKIKSMKLLLLVAVGLIVDIFLNAFFVYSDLIQSGTRESVVYGVMIYVYNCLCCILLMAVQFGLVLQRRLENELDIVKSLSRLRAEQYMAAKENVDIINQKCHDMKHQIRKIGTYNRLPSDVVEEIERSVSLYDATVKTGNEVLDTILTEKSLRCVANNILMSCVADGAKISFIGDSDLYALFGNALDNAIEAVLKIDDPEKRIIGLILYEKNGFVTLNINNTFDGEIKLENGLPLTTKANGNIHGFGVKSIKMIVERYGGELAVTAKDGLFSLSILIPVRNE